MKQKISRRSLLKSSGALAIGLGISSPSLLVKAQSSSDFSADVYHFKLGTVSMMVISDGAINIPTEFFIGAPPSIVQDFLDRHYLPTDVISGGLNVILMEDHNGLTLFDVGSASFSLGDDPSGGRLVENLRAIGIEPEDINNVVITHAHPDHLGAFSLDFQNPTFSNATHYISRTEWDYWTNLPEDASELDHNLAQFTAPNLLAVQQKAELYEGSPHFWDGMRMVGTPGHTIDHKAVLLESQGEQLLITGDAVTLPTMSLKHPEWYLVVEYDAERGVRSRINLLNDASDARMKVLVYHAPFPGLGYIKGSSLIKNHWDWLQSS